MLVLVLKTTDSFTVAPPATLPSGQATLTCPLVVPGDVHPESVSDTPLTDTIVTSVVGKVTLRTTCVAVEPPTPDSFLNSVTDSALFVGEMKCGPRNSFTQVAAVGDGPAQIFLPAAFPPIADASTAATITTPSTQRRVRVFTDTCRITGSPLPIATARMPPTFAIAAARKAI